MTDPASITGWVRGLITSDMVNSARNRQTSIGPSQLGTPCVRQLGYRALRANGHLTPLDTRDKLAAWVGTQAHTRMADLLAAQDGWQAEVRVEAEVRRGWVLRGQVDAWNPEQGLVVDWKFVGDQTIDTARLHGLTGAYRCQVQTYGRLLELGREAQVRTVAVAFVPRSGPLSRTVTTTAPYDVAEAETVISRYDAVRQVIGHLGPSVLPQLPAADGPCLWCPAHDFRATTPTLAGCPGPTTTTTHPLGDPT